MSKSDNKKDLTFELFKQIASWSKKNKDLAKEEIVSLIAKGADVNAIENIAELNREEAEKITTPLRLAVSLGYYDAVKILLKEGAKIDVDTLPNNNSDGKTTMALAAQGNYTSIIASLFYHGSSVNPTKENIIGPLHCAAREGHKDALGSLLILQADVNAVAAKGRTPLMEAIINNHENIVKKLCEHEELDINKKDDAGNTALMLAVALGNVKMTKYILNVGAGKNNDDRDSNNNTALHIGAGNKNTNILQLLLDHGANIESKNEFGQTPLMSATLKGNSKAVSWFLNQHPVSDINASSKEGWTPLMVAIHLGYFEIVDEMMSEKNRMFLDLEALNNKGQNAMDIAKEHLQDESQMAYKKIVAGLKTISQEQKENKTPHSSTFAKENKLTNMSDNILVKQ